MTANFLPRVLKTTYSYCVCKLQSKIVSKFKSKVANWGIDKREKLMYTRATGNKLQIQETKK